jgi:hypothetical protein
MQDCLATGVFGVCFLKVEDWERLQVSEKGCLGIKVTVSSIFHPLRILYQKFLNSLLEIWGG